MGGTRVNATIEGQLSYPGATDVGQKANLLPSLGGAWTYRSESWPSSSELSNRARRSAARASVKSLRNRTSASPQCLGCFTHSDIAVPCCIPGDSPAIAKTVSLVRPSGAYSEILRSPCMFSTQNLSKDSSRCWRTTTYVGSPSHE